MLHAWLCVHGLARMQGLEEEEEAAEAEEAAVDEEEDGVPLDRLIAIHPRRPLLQCSLNLNLARCSLHSQAGAHSTLWAC